jgi:hypothetical protein
MKLKQFRSILVVTIIAASITASLSPAQAFTWDDLWNVVKSRAEGSRQPDPSPQPIGSDNQAPSDSDLSNSGSQQTNDTDKSSPAIQESTGKLESKCIMSHGHPFRWIGEGEKNSMISVGQRPVNVYGSIDLNSTFQPIYGSTCQIESHPSDGKVSYSLAIPDVTNLYKVRLISYVDGQQRATIMIRAGQKRTLSIDIRGASSYAFQVQLVEGSGEIYFHQ